MYYRISTQSLPEIHEVETLTRKTVWRCADKRNILLYLKKGTCVFIINGNEYILSADQFMFIPAEQAYVRKPYNNESCEFVYIHFTTEEPITQLTFDEAEAQFNSISSVQEESSLFNNRNPNKIDPYVYLSQITTFSEKDVKNIRKLLNNIVYESKSHQYYGKLLISLTFMEILSTFSRKILSDFCNNKLFVLQDYPKPLQKAIIFCNKNFNQRITVEELSKHCNISHQHLIRLFRKHMHMSPVQYINKNKIFHAIDMLRSTELSVKEIAYELGYEDTSYFIRIFKKEEKMTPTQVRRRINNYEKEKEPSPVTE